MLKFFTLKMNQGPWGPWSGDGTQKPQNPNPQFKAETNKNNSGGGSQNSSGQGPSDQNDFLKKITNYFSNNKSPKQLAALITLSVTVLWLSSGFYKINPDENGIVLYFGKFYSIATPGLNYYIPYPFGELVKKSVTTVNTEEFGYNSNDKKSDNKKGGRNLEAESLMLTGDENIVDIEFQVQWQISNIEEFAFNIADTNLTIRKAAESAMREVIARTPISEALSDGKSNIEQTTRALLQQSLDAYKSGVRIVLVQLRRVDPPSQVIDAFRDVQTAKADKEKEINQAQAYANDIIPRARGSAAQLEGQAEAFKAEVVTNAEGEAARFIAVYNQYIKSKKVTKKRIYLETMEKIYRDSDKVVIDKNAARSSVTSYFPLNDLNNSANIAKPKPEAK